MLQQDNRKWEKERDVWRASTAVVKVDGVEDKMDWNRDGDSEIAEQDVDSEIAGQDVASQDEHSSDELAVPGTNMTQPKDTETDASWNTPEITHSRTRRKEWRSCKESRCREQ